MTRRLFTRRLFIDIETFSTVDVKDGLYPHAENAEVLLFGYAFDRDDPKLWSPAEGEAMPKDLEAGLRDPSVLVHAFNAQYEIVVLREVWKAMQMYGLIPVSLAFPDLTRWRCDMVLALTKSLPGSLDKLGPILNMPVEKQKLAEGKRLIRLFCQHRKPTANKPWDRADHTNEPEKWDLFKQYNLGDVSAQQQVFYRLQKWPVPEHEQELWRLDQQINDRGLPIDIDLCRGAIELAEREQEQMHDELQRLTGLDNPNSITQLMEWLEDQNVFLMNLQKLTVSQTLERDDLPDDVRRVLTLRLQTSKNSVKKYTALINAVTRDGRLCGAFQFAGANRTWRWTGRKFQPHNLPRGYKNSTDLSIARELILERDPDNLLPVMLDPTMEVLSGCLRSVVRAPDGYLLNVCDLNAIENRVLGWVAECDTILAVHRAGLCPYRDFGTRFFLVSYDQIDDAMRTLSKPPVLGCGYMLSGGEMVTDKNGVKFRTGLWAYAHDMGVPFSRDQAHQAVTVFRDTYPEVVNYWYAVDDAFRRVIQTRQPVSVGPITFHFSNPFVCIRLPSGRGLYYYRATIEPRIPPWERDKENPKTKPTICYWGQDQETKAWKKLTTHPGKITENIVQAVARDILAEGLKAADQAQLDVRGHVHDEIIILSPEQKARQQLDVLTECMSRDIAWAPGLPLGAEGFTTKAYRKD